MMYVLILDLTSLLIQAAWPCLRSQYTTYVNICVEITYRCIIFYGSATAFFVKVKVHVIK